MLQIAFAQVGNDLDLPRPFLYCETEHHKVVFGLSKEEMATAAA